MRKKIKHRSHAMRHHLKTITLFAVGITAVAYLFYFRKLFFFAEYPLPRDNATLHFPTFQIIAAHLRYLNQFPDWLFPAGIPLRWIGNNAVVLTPYKALGYLIAANSKLSLNQIYKLSVIFFGMGGFLTGIYFLARKLFQSWWYSLAAVLFAATSSVTLVFFHQEHALGTMFLVPFIALAFLRAIEKPRWLIIASGLLGIAMNHHYPQLLIIYFLLLGIAVVADRTTRNFIRPIWSSLRQNPRWLVYSVFAFCVGAMPVLTTYLSEHARLSSPYRLQGESIEAQSYAEYRDMNLLQLASVWPRDLKLYSAVPTLKPEHLADLDDFAFYMGPWAIFLIAFYFCFGKARVFHGVMLVGLVLLAIGIYGPMPRLLWSVIPGIRLFRQYYYFLAFFNLHLLFLTLLCVRTWAQIDFSTKHNRWCAFALATGLLLASILGWQPALRWIPPTVALLACCFRASLSQKMVFGLLAIALLHQGAWTTDCLIGIQARMTSPAFEPPFIESEEDFASALRNEVPINPMVAPKATELGALMRTNMQGQMFWEKPNGEKRLVAKDEVTMRFDPGIIRIIFQRIPEGFSTLMWAQWNDKRWRSFPVVSAGTLLRFPAKKGGGVSLARKRYPWHRVVILTWLAIFTCFLLIEFPLRNLFRRPAA